MKVQIKIKLVISLNPRKRLNASKWFFFTFSLFINAMRLSKYEYKNKPKCGTKKMMRKRKSLNSVQENDIDGPDIYPISPFLQVCRNS